MVDSEGQTLLAGGARYAVLEYGGLQSCANVGVAAPLSVEGLIQGSVIEAVTHNVFFLSDR